MNMVYNTVLPFMNKHIYIFAVEGMKKHSMEFGTRQSARRYMYHLMKKYNLHTVEKIEEKHIETFICNDGVSFYISRL